jgi:hypothetical protein
VIIGLRWRARFEGASVLHAVDVFSCRRTGSEQDPVASPMSSRPSPERTGAAETLISRLQHTLCTVVLSCTWLPTYSTYPTEIPCPLPLTSPCPATSGVAPVSYLTTQIIPVALCATSCTCTLRKPHIPIPTGAALLPTASPSPCLARHHHPTTSLRAAMSSTSAHGRPTVPC